MLPVLPGVSPAVSAVWPGGGAGQVSEGLQPAPGQLRLLQVVAQEAAGEGKERPLGEAGLQVGAEDGEPRAVQPQRAVQLCLSEVHRLLRLQVRLLLRHGDPVLVLTGWVAGAAGATLAVPAQPQPFWHRALPPSLA